MNKEAIRLLYEYNRWANSRILDAAAMLTVMGYSPGDLDLIVFLRGA